MKKKFRFISMAMAAVMCVSCFCGCGKDTSDKDEQGRTVISIGGWPTQEGTSLDNYNKQKAEYEANNPDAVITPDTWAFDLKTFYAKAAGGQLPTLFRSMFTEVEQVANADYAADISEVLKDRGYDGQINKAVLDIISKDDKIFAMPTEAYVQGLLINTDMFEKAGLMEADGTPKQPKTWDEVIDYAVKIKQATGKAGIIVPTASKIGGWIFTVLAWSFGTDFMEQDTDGNWKATFDSPEAAAALQYIKDLKWKYDVLPSNTLIDYDEWDKLFATGAGAMRIGNTGVLSGMTKYGMNPNSIGLVAMPAGPKKHVTLLGGKVSYVKNGATKDQIDACIRWLEMSNSFKATDEFKQSTERTIKEQLENNQLVGANSFSIWNNDSEAVKFQNELIAKNANINVNHVKLYNEFIADCPAEIQPEEPVCCQQLYEVLDKCIQEVLTNENADCSAVLAKANADFQKDYLDNIDY